MNAAAWKDTRAVYLAVGSQYSDILTRRPNGHGEDRRRQQASEWFQDYMALSQRTE